MKKLLIFIDELYFPKSQHSPNSSSELISSYSAALFFKDINVGQKSYMVPVSKGAYAEPKEFSTTIPLSTHKVYELPPWNSVVTFAKYYFKSTKNRTAIESIFQQAIVENDIFWVRNPSLPGILFSSLVLKKGKRLYCHIAGDIGNAWKNEKYRGINRIFAYSMSKFMEYKLKVIAKSSQSMLFCTGSAMTNLFKKLNTNTFFFIDCLIRSTELTEHEFDQQTHRFIYVGRLTEDKGIKLLLTAFLNLAKTHSNIHLTLIGFGPLQSFIKHFIKDNNLEKYINFVGYIPNEHLHKYLKQSDIFVLPSQAPYEGFPRVIVEAWSFGLAVISTNVGGIEGLGRHEENILFCKKGSVTSLLSALKRIVDEPVLKRSLKEGTLRNRKTITYDFYKQLVEDKLNLNALQ